MTKPKQSASKRDQQWAEAKRRCRLNREDIRLAKELGLNPRSLIKNIPAPTQQWKLPVKQWIHELYAKKTGKSLLKNPRKAGSLKRHHRAETATVPLEAYADDPAWAEIPSSATADEALADWEVYCAESCDDQEDWWLPESRLHQEIREENQRAQQRQGDFRVAAEYLAQAFGQIPAVEKVVLFGSVACALQEEPPRTRRYRRAGLPMLHMCSDIDLAVWLGDTTCLRTLQKARAQALTRLLEDHGIGVAHHQVDVFIMEPGSDRYLGRLCTYALCPTGKPECRVAGCGLTPLLRQHEGFTLHVSALRPDKSLVLVDTAKRPGSGCCRSGEDP
jgi:hypothetical protein